MGMLRIRKIMIWPCAWGVLSSLLVTGVSLPPASESRGIQDAAVDIDLLADVEAEMDEDREGSNALTWITLARGFTPSVWGEQEKAPNRIRFTNGNPLQAEIRLRDGDTGVTSSDQGRERAELFLYYNVLDSWFKTHRHVRLTYELKLGRDFDVHQQEAGSRRIFQIKSSKASGNPIFDVNIEGGIMQIRHYPGAASSVRPVILAEGPAPDPRKNEWIPVRLESYFTKYANGYLLMRVGKLTVNYQGPTQHSINLNNFKIGEYRNEDYSSGIEPHLIRDPWLRVAL